MDNASKFEVGSVISIMVKIKNKNKKKYKKNKKIKIKNKNKKNRFTKGVIHMKKKIQQK